MPVRKRAVAAAAQLLVELLETGAPAEPVEVVVTDGSVEVRVIVHRADTTQAAGGHRTDSRAVGGEVADAIRAVLKAAPAPLKLATIARKSGRELTSHFRKVAYDMAAAGELVHHDGHRYSLRTQ